MVNTRKLKVDLTGQKFGKLTVVKMLPNYKGNHKVYCECVCDCGTTGIIKRTDGLVAAIRKNNIPSCGCVDNSPKEHSSYRKDLTGQKFGHLTVIEMLYGYNSYGQAFCRCKCECGNECIKQAYSLTNPKGNPPHCGCLTDYYKQIQSEKSRKDLTGQRFGRLVVQEMIWEFKKQTLARCKCDCGNEITVPITYLTSGETTSCGCYHSEQTTKSNTKDFTGMVSDYGVKILRRYKKNSHGVWLWVCECGYCGKEFVAMPARVFENHIISCGCLITSKGEIDVANILDELDINYEQQYTYDDCKYINKLKFDFKLSDYPILIEYQGQQHYHKVDLFGGEEGFRQSQIRDQIKRDYCKNNGLFLLEIPYTLTYNEIKEEIINIIYPKRLYGVV